ncbi:hypothetical protein BT69DRAFT_1126586 [Atractiella rhizophila]|nr:hypothetical protein BT69DRAFT_1126586 [Atractiella rhizophila]
MTKRRTKKTRGSTPLPATPDASQNPKPEYQQGATPRNIPPNFKLLQRNLQLGERFKSESPVVVLEDLHPNIDVEIELPVELMTYKAADWKDDCAKMGGVLIHHEIEPPVIAYSNISLSFEFQDQLQSAASDGNTQLARNAAYTLGARPRCFVWNLLIDKDGDKQYSWSNCMRGGHFRGKPKGLEDHFKEVARTIAKFAKASEEQIGFLNIFDHDPAWHFTWELDCRSRIEEPVNQFFGSTPHANLPNVPLRSVEPTFASAATPSSTMLLPSQFIPNPNHKFKLDLTDV